MLAFSTIATINAVTAADAILINSLAVAAAEATPAYVLAATAVEAIVAAIQAVVI